MHMSLQKGRQQFGGMPGDSGGRFVDPLRQVWLQRMEEGSDEELLEVGVCRGAAPSGLHFIDVAPVGSILAPGRVWAMLEGEGDTRKDFAAPCCGEIAEVNEEAIQAGDASSWLIRVYCDRVLPDMQPE